MEKPLDQEFSPVTIATVPTTPAFPTLVHAETPQSWFGRAVRGGAILMSARAFVQPFTWFISLYVASILLPSDYGIMTFGMIFIGLADLLSEAGVAKTIVYKEDLSLDDINRAFSRSVVIAGLLYVLLYIAAPWIEQIGRLPATFLRVLALFILLAPLRSVALGLLDRHLHLGQQAAAHVVTQCAQSVLVLSLAFAGLGYWALAFGALVGRSLEVMWLLWSARWWPQIIWPHKTPNRSQRDPFVWFGIHVSVSSLLWYFYSNADFAILGQLTNPTELGYYSLAFQLMSLPVQKVTGNVNQVVYPLFCRLQNDPDRRRDLYLRLTVMLGFICMPVLTGMALVAPDAFGLILKDRWLPAVLPFQLLSFVGLLMVFASSLIPLFNSIGRPDINLWYTGTCTLLLPIGFFVGVLNWGVVGVCLAWLVIYPVIVLALVILTKPLTTISLLDLIRAQLPVFCSVLFMAIVVMGINWKLADEERIWLRLSLAITAGILSYTLGILILTRNTVMTDLKLLLAEIRR